MTDSLPHFTVQVDPTDCDVLGHVNHARYLVFFERARWAVVKPHLPHGRLERGALWAVVRHVDIGYHAEAVPGDELEIRSGLERVGRTSFTIRQQARKRDGTMVSEARITLVTIGRGTPVPVPDAWRAMFPRWPADDESPEQSA